jgi:hypothetical protein|tara:strand:- start:2888 stop:3427 length:540 start_codon:yes stop_codon:yes gene_type:complete
MANATTIQDFFSRASYKQFSRDFLFRVKQIDLVGVSFDGDKDLVYAKTAALPGRVIENKVVNYFGQEFQLPGRATYENAAGYSIDFYHDDDCSIRTKLEKASRTVWNNDTSTGEYSMPGNESVINLVQIDKQLNDVRNIQLVGASIRSIGDIAYTIAEGTGEVLTYTVTFAYHFYRDFS